MGFFCLHTMKRSIKVWFSLHVEANSQNSQNWSAENPGPTNFQSHDEKLLCGVRYVCALRLQLFAGKNCRDDTSSEVVLTALGQERNISTSEIFWDFLLFSNQIFCSLLSLTVSCLYIEKVGYAIAQLVEELRYKPEGRGFDSRWCNWNFLLT